MELFHRLSIILITTATLIVKLEDLIFCNIVKKTGKNIILLTYFPGSRRCRCCHIYIYIGMYSFDFVPKTFTHAPASCYGSVWAFLSALQIQPVDSPNAGVTWIELLIIYNLLGGLHDLSQDGWLDVPCRRMQTTKQEIVQFHRLVRAIIKHFAHEHEQQLF